MDYTKIRIPMENIYLVKIYMYQLLNWILSFTVPKCEKHILNFTHTHSMVKPVLYSIKSNFFLFCKCCMYYCWSCKMHTSLRLLQCQWIFVLPGNYMYMSTVCELRIDTLNISESLDGALFYLQALKSCEKATKPVYVSPGHKISIDSATELVHRCSKYRVPEPIRQVNHWFSATLILQCQYGNLCGFF